MLGVDFDENNYPPTDAAFALWALDSVVSGKVAMNFGYLESSVTTIVEAVQEAECLCFGGRFLLREVRSQTASVFPSSYHLR